MLPVDETMFEIYGHTMKATGLFGEELEVPADRGGYLAAMDEYRQLLTVFRHHGIIDGYIDGIMADNASFEVKQ